MFKRTNKAAVGISKILAEFNGDLGIAFAAQKDSPLKYGSELRDTSDLSKLFYYHKDKINIINIIQQGYRYHLDPTKEETQKFDLDAIILRGNHKSSHSEINSAALEKSISKEIYHRWVLPLTIKYLQNIKKRRGHAPGGCRTIFNILEGGTIYQKTCDSILLISRTFRTICKQPVPTRITTTMLLLLLTAQDTPHDLSNAKKWPTKQIFLGKTDLDSAYCLIW